MFDESGMSQFSSCIMWFHIQEIKYLVTPDLSGPGSKGLLMREHQPHGRKIQKVLFRHIYYKIRGK